MLPRHTLPQIPEHKHDEFRKYLDKYDIGTVRGMVEMDKLRPIQQSVNIDKVKGLRSNKDALRKPIIISKDGHILDGHHRWLANKTLGNEKQLVIKCDLPIDDLIERGLEFPGAEIKTIKEFIGPTHQTNMTDFGITPTDEPDEDPSGTLMIRKTLNYE